MNPGNGSSILLCPFLIQIGVREGEEQREGKGEKRLLNFFEVCSMTWKSVHQKERLSLYICDKSSHIKGNKNNFYQGASGPRENF